MRHKRTWLVLLMALVLACSVAQARELAVPESELIAVELATVGAVPGTGAPVVLLRAPDSGGIVPIFIGYEEARAILLALRGIEAPRPMSHDLMLALITTLEADVERVVVDDMRAGVYYGMVELRERNSDRRLRIDARPSDALALAVRAQADIHVAPAVLHAGSGIEFEGLEDDPVVTALGITVVEATPALREALDLPDGREGVVVSAVSAAAASYGVRPGVLITAVNRAVPSDPMLFLDLVRQTPADERVELEFWLDGRARSIEVRPEVPRREDALAL